VQTSQEDKGFADKELPILIEKGLSYRKRFEPTSPATTMVGWERFGLATHATDDSIDDVKRSLDTAGSAH